MAAYLGVFGGGTQHQNFLLVLCKLYGWSWRHIVKFKLSPNPQVVWWLVVTLQIAEKAKFKHTLKCVMLINTTFKEKSQDCRTAMAVYLTDTQTVSVRLICDYFFWRGRALHCFCPWAPKTLVTPLHESALIFGYNLISLKQCRESRGSV